MIKSSDLIAIVNLPKTYSHPYKVKIEKVLIGEFAQESLTVYEFDPWRRKVRPFYTGKAILVLEFNQDKNYWQIVGPAAEGRISLDKHYAFSFGISLPDSEMGIFRIGDYKVNALRYSKPDFVSAFEDVSRCFMFNNKDIITRCEENTLTELKNKSNLHRHLIENIGKR